VVAMNMNNNGIVLISGASFAGHATARWMKKEGYNVRCLGTEGGQLSRFKGANTRSWR
jgi:NADP-dependent 3-hydroxy acid dehydrogenase YdfG